MFYFAQSGQVRARRPRPMQIDGKIVLNPTDEQYVSQETYPLVLDETDTPEGYRVAGRDYQINDDTAYEVKLFEPIPPRVPTERQIASAVQFRDILHKHFGEGAETSRAVTMGAVETYFNSLHSTGDLTPELLADFMLLERLFSTIEAFNGDGTSWTFFEDVDIDAKGMET